MERETETTMDLAPLHAFLEGLKSLKNFYFYKEMKKAFNELAFLKSLLMDPLQELVEDGSLKKFESWASKAGSIISSFDPKEVDEDVDRNMYSELGSISMDKNMDWAVAAKRIYDKEPKPSRIYYPKTDQLGFVDHLVENLEELIRAKSDSIGPLKSNIFRLQQKLRFLSSGVMEIPEPRKEEADLKHLMESITNLAYEAEYAIDSFLVRAIPIWHCMFWLADILEEFKHKKTLLKMESGNTLAIITSVTHSKFDRLYIIPLLLNTEIIMKLWEVHNSVGIRLAFTNHMWIPVSSYKEEKKELLLAILRNVSKRPEIYESYSDDSDEDVYTSDMDEDVLENSVRQRLQCGSYIIFLVDVRDIDTVNDILRILPDDHNGSRVFITTPYPELVVQCRDVLQKDFSNKMLGYHTSTSQINKPKIDDDVVGFKVETEGMLEQLIGEPKQLRIISIVGMAGQGKTTLANKLYNNLSVINYFHIRAWCFVSQVYKKRELLLELLGQIVQLSDPIHHMNDEELAAMLCRSLRGRRFLVVLDDMWDTGAWNDLRRCFPNDNNGSRIIFTTRLQQLASQAQSSSMLQSLSPLSDDESWVLLEKKLFQKERCPPELLAVRRKIAKNCKGLPLSVILTVGLLAKIEKKVGMWEQIAKKISSHILGDTDAQCKGIIELSYKHLHDHLQSCLLYFGAFLEDREVSFWKLIRLWIAEGFIKNNDLKSLEDVAEDYLMDLVERSLITVAKEKYNGGVKSCRIHDLLREFL